MFIDNNLRQKIISSLVSDTACDDMPHREVMITIKNSVLTKIDRILADIGAFIIEKLFGDRIIYARVPVTQLLESRIDTLYAWDPETVVAIPEKVYQSSGELEISLNRSVSFIKKYRDYHFPDEIPNSHIPLDGRGTIIAVVDSGLDSSLLDFADRVKVEVNFSTDPDHRDYCGHGTHVAGIAAGSESPFTGVAPGAELWNIKVLNSHGVGDFRSIIRGLQRIYEKSRDRDEPVVVNLSLGSYNPSCAGTCPLCQAVQSLEKLGILVCAAAGNDGPLAGTINCPARSRGSLAVTACDLNRRIPSFSSRGPSPDPDITTPGVNITSVTPGGKYLPFSGTSMASPHVAGAAALLAQLLRSREQNSTADNLRKAILRANQLPVSRSLQGQGVLNLPIAAGLIRQNGESHKSQAFKLLNLLKTGQELPCANHPEKLFWHSKPGRIHRCRACNRILCPSCRRKSSLCDFCREKATK